MYVVLSKISKSDLEVELIEQYSAGIIFVDDLLSQCSLRSLFGSAVTRLRSFYMIMAATFKNVVQAQLYALYRPGYPDTLRQGLVKYIQQRTTPPLSKQTVIDVGCGAGQSTFFLAKAGFGKVRGVDNSKAQVIQAECLSRPDD